MKIAIVILNWNGSTLLQRFLPSVVAYSKEASIYVIDNGSTDDSKQVLKEKFPTVSLINLDSNYGFTGGYNRGLKQVKADVYCLLNSDIRVTEDWLVPIAHFFESKPKVSILQPKILDEKYPSHFEYAGAAGGFVDKFGYPYCRGRIFQELEEDYNQFESTTEILWATGACLFIKSDCYWSLDGLDESYFAHQEEIDLCWRAFNAGHKIGYVAESKVYHLGGSTLKSSNPKKTFLNFRNSLFNLIKNAPSKGLIGTLFLRLVLDGIAGMHFLFSLKPSHFFAVLRAHLSFYSNLPKLLKKRKKYPNEKKYYTIKSIVWQHFVSKVNSFNNLVKD